MPLKEVFITSSRSHRFARMHPRRSAGGRLDRLRRMRGGQGSGIFLRDDPDRLAYPQGFHHPGRARKRPALCRRIRRARVSFVRGHPMAKAGLEMALWDLRGKAEGKSLKELFGGVRDKVDVGVSVGIQPSVEKLLAAVDGYLAKGYGRVKIKIKPGRETAETRAVRQGSSRTETAGGRQLRLYVGDRGPFWTNLTIWACCSSSSPSRTTTSGTTACCRRACARPSAWTRAFYLPGMPARRWR